MELTQKDNYMEQEPYPIVIPLQDMLEITRTISGDAYTLYFYYHSKGMKWRWRNANIAKDLNWSIRKVERIKKELKDNGWIYWFQHKGNKYTYIGKRQSLIGKDEEKEEKTTNP